MDAPVYRCWQGICRNPCINLAFEPHQNESVNWVKVEAPHDLPKPQRIMAYCRKCNLTQVVQYRSCTVNNLCYFERSWVPYSPVCAFLSVHHQFQDHSATNDCQRVIRVTLLFLRTAICRISVFWSNGSCGSNLT
jgi:hypothetical protein